LKEETTMKRTVIFLNALLLLLPSVLEAQKVATSSFQFLKVMPTARGTAMGDAYVTLASGAEALFWNPSGLALATNHQFSTTATLWLFDTYQGAFAYALPLGEIGTVGLQLQYVHYGEIKETRADQLQFVGPAGNQVYNPGLTGSTFSPYAYVVGLTYARQLTSGFSAGLTAKFVNESLYGASSFSVVNPATGETESYKTYANVLLFDFGIRYRTDYRSIEIGASVQNFGSQVKFAKEEYPAPLAFRLGVAADLMGRDALFLSDETNRFTVAYDLFQPNDYEQQMHVGVEYAFAGIVALRAGYKINYDNDGLTFGAGVNTDLAGFNLGFDYSYGAMGDYLGKVHRISLGVKFK
jgi:hypothetical protein